MTNSFSFDTGIMDIINEDSKTNLDNPEITKRFKKDLEMFKSLKKATKALQNIKLVDGCDEIKMNPITNNSRF